MFGRFRVRYQGFLWLLRRDFSGDGGEFVDAHDPGDLAHQAFDEAEVAAG